MSESNDFMVSLLKRRRQHNVMSTDSTGRSGSYFGLDSY